MPGHALRHRSTVLLWPVILQAALAIQFRSSTYGEQQKLSCSLTEIAISNGWRSSCDSPDQQQALYSNPLTLSHWLNQSRVINP